MYQRFCNLLMRLKGLLPAGGVPRAAFAAALPSKGWQRGAPRAVDRILLSETHVWLRRIPSSLLPKHLCRHHPHVVNRFAACWGDRACVEALVDELLTDTRGGRQGFSPRVQAELVQLERLHARALANPIGQANPLVPRRRRMRLGRPVFEATFPGPVTLMGTTAPVLSARRRPSRSCSLEEAPCRAASGRS
ncbi:MAG: hypothetical protein ABI520_11650 [Caldimonas sp.]